MLRMIPVSSTEDGSKLIRHGQSGLGKDAMHEQLPLSAQKVLARKDSLIDQVSIAIASFEQTQGLRPSFVQC